MTNTSTSGSILPSQLPTVVRDLRWNGDMVPQDNEHVTSHNIVHDDSQFSDHSPGQQVVTEADPDTIDFDDKTCGLVYPSPSPAPYAESTTESTCIAAPGRSFGAPDGATPHPPCNISMSSHLGGSPGEVELPLRSDKRGDFIDTFSRGYPGQTTNLGGRAHYQDGRRTASPSSSDEIDELMEDDLFPSASADPSTFSPANEIMQSEGYLHPTPPRLAPIADALPDAPAITAASARDTASQLAAHALMSLSKSPANRPKRKFEDEEFDECAQQELRRSQRTKRPRLAPPPSPPSISSSTQVTTMATRSKSHKGLNPSSVTPRKRKNRQEKDGENGKRSQRSRRAREIPGNSNHQKAPKGRKRDAGTDRSSRTGANDDGYEQSTSSRTNTNEAQIGQSVEPLQPQPKGLRRSDRIKNRLALGL